MGNQSIRTQLSISNTNS